MPTKPSKIAQNLIPRPPVVVVMGHIDHGKSTLLDYIRKTNIVAGEVGGITQHVGAYQVEHVSADGKRSALTFLDTPGHEAFCSIRERGAQAADVAVLVVSAEDGVKPQTIEAYENIKERKIPFIVAINKIDKPNANIDKARTSLGENEIYVEGWGGDIPCVPISALNGKGVPELLDMILLVAELANIKTDTTLPAEGVVVESERDARKGISSTLLIKNGTLYAGTFVVAGNAYAPVRFIENFKGEKIESAGASVPVKIYGWNAIPACGGLFMTVSSKKEAEEMIENFSDKEKELSNADNANTEESEIVTIPVIIKADVIGSLEGIEHELAKIKHDKVQLKIISRGIGHINENDIKTALSDPNIIILGFNTDPDAKAAAIIERAATPIQVKTFKIIYELTEFARATLLSKIPKEYVEETLGTLRILAVFSKEKDRQVVGGKVQSGSIKSGAEIKIMRRENEIGRGKIREVQEKKQRVDEATTGHECGLMVDAKIEITVGDKIEAVRTVEI